MPHQRPEPDGSILSAAGGAPCDCTSYSQIKISRQGREPYQTEFYECTGCTVMSGIRAASPG